MRAKGFTLIELLVVIAIIGILASIVMVSLSSSLEKSRDGKRIADLSSIKLALEIYYTDHQAYPIDLYAASGSLYPTYLPKVPLDPKDNSQYHYEAQGGATCTGYHLGAAMEQTSNAGLTQDYDAGSGPGSCSGTPQYPFNGNALNCSGTAAASPDNCYDVTN